MARAPVSSSESKSLGEAITPHKALLNSPEKHGRVLAKQFAGAATGQYKNEK